MEHKEESNKSFWKGVATGLGIACVISLMALGITYVSKNMQSLMRIVSRAEIESVAEESTMEKLSLLEETIEEYFWKDVEPQKLADGVYEGLLLALDDPYSEYYTHEELEALMQQTQGIYYGIGTCIFHNLVIAYHDRFSSDHSSTCVGDFGYCSSRGVGYSAFACSYSRGYYYPYSASF